ncbi:conjugal transfer protein TraF [Rickettsia amblyommatis]|uniref:F pilus assembly protein TraF n=1 Tax=Rickettsia amblyommatis (strain GAT-30V) TaxID=1105111 RepID=H8K642_RICAG|nr:conjugal transfer protein TraF [Rickettsia amblyommatis]AFC69986.1 F pilus assembly protein TraF [Rickettsia amblyommatis str. GAT-30V]KJV91259.1 F plasmid transfer operon family protein [Rickettsia amblyommatis str. Darkwater]
MLTKLLLTTSLLILINHSLNNAFAATVDLNSGSVKKMTDLELVRQLQYGNQPQGFLWYNEDQLEKQHTLKQRTLESIAPKLNQELYDQRIENLKQQFDKAKRQALDNPTLTNVMIAQRLHKQILDKSHKFATMWQLATLLDYRLTNNNIPANSLHKRLYEVKQEANRAKLRLLSQEWGLILQVNQRCSYCHAFAPIVQEFASQYGFQIIFVSNNGADFADLKTTKDTGLLSRLNPENLVPVLYLVASSGAQIYPVARGIISTDKLAENILAIIQHHNRLKVDYEQ